MKAPAILLACWAVPLAAQGGAPGAPLRPTDVIRLLAQASAPADVADRIGRDCLTFTPTARDRRNFQALGADSAVMARIEACARRGVRKAPAVASAPAVAPAATPAAVPATAPATPAPGTGTPAAATPAPPPAPPTPQPSPEKTGFVEGVGQRGVVGLPAAAPLVFEVRDADGKPLSKVRVTFTADNAQLRAEAQTTDTAGHVRVDVTFGPKAGKAVVRAAVGQIFRSATLYPTAASAAKLELHLGGATVGDTLALAADTSVTLRVLATDEYGNPVALLGLQPLSGDEGIVRVEHVGGDTAAGLLTLKARAQGNTQLALQGSGVLANVTVVVGAH